MRTLILLPLLALALSACAPERGHIPGGEFDPTVRTRDPATLVSLLVSTTTPEASRKSADALLVEAKGKTDPTRLGVLEQILYAPGHSDAMRIYALDQLADAGRLARPLSLHLPKLEGKVLAHACELAVKEGDDSLVDPLIRSLERGLGEALKNRPEWPALEKLAARPVEETLYSRLAGATDRSVRTAALDILPSVQPAVQIKDRLKAMSSRDPWFNDLQWWIATFDGLPFGENEIVWIQYLRHPERAALVARALERHHRLHPQPGSGGGATADDYVPAPRFVHTLAYIDDATLALSRDALLAQLKTRLDAFPHAHRPPEYANSPDDLPDTLDAAAPKLTRADLFNILLLLRAFEDPANLQEFQRLGTADLNDNTTEHGGLLAFLNIQRPTLTITPYAPLYANTDFEYVASDRLLQETPAGIAQYHFHFQSLRNADRAGPGPGDLAYVRRTRCTCVVITSVAPRQLNIDYYTPTGALLDLGTYTVPQ